MISWLSFYIFIILFSVLGSIGMLGYVWGKEKYNRKMQLKIALKNAKKEQEMKKEEEKKELEMQKEEMLFEKFDKFEPTALGETQKINNEIVSDTELMKMMKQAETKIGMHEYEEAEKILIQILSYQELYREALEAIGHLYLLVDKPAKAAFFLEQHLENHVENPSIYTNYALANLHLQNFDTAVKYYGKAIDMDPSNPIRYSNLGHVLLTLHHFDDAIRCFQEAIKLDPRNREYYTIIADTLRKNNHFAESKEWYLKILGFSPYDQHAQTELERLNALGF